MSWKLHRKGPKISLQAVLSLIIAGDDFKYKCHKYIAKTHCPI